MPAHHALPHKTHEAYRPDVACSSRRNTQLVPPQEGLQFRPLRASNNKFKLTIKKTFGFRSFDVMEVAVLHQLVKLPEPQFTHEFW